MGSGVRGESSEFGFEFKFLRSGGLDGPSRSSSASAKVRTKGVLGKGNRRVYRVEDACTAGRRSRAARTEERQLMRTATSVTRKEGLSGPVKPRRFTP